MKIKTKPRARRPYFLIIIGLALITAGVAASGLILRQQITSSGDETDSSQTTPPITTVGLSSKVLFTGNVFWGRYINDWSQQSELKYAYPFSRLGEFGRENYNAWVGGLECPTSPRVDTTSAQQEATLSFNCRPEYLPEAAKYFTAFTLANNHTDNQGPEGFTETR